MTNSHNDTRAIRAAIAAMAERIDIDTTTPAVGNDTTFWAALSEAGFAGIGLDEAAGGSGGTRADALDALAAITETGSVTPFLEHTLLASRMAADAGCRVTSSITTLAVADDSLRIVIDDRSAPAQQAVLEGTVRGVVHAEVADTIVILVDGGSGAPARLVVVSLSEPGVTIGAGTDLVGISCADVTFESTPTRFVGSSAFSAADLRDHGALAYSVALSAAAAAVRELTIRHAMGRTQFGRPLARFQAVAQRLAQLAARCAMNDAAVSAAVQITADDAPATPQAKLTALAAAKVITSSSAHEIAAAGHQIHGAIGFSSEHRLGRFTTELWTWRDRYGDESEWADVLAGQILDDGHDVWDVIVGSDEPPATEAGAEE